jgi:hypothetical protein
VDRAKLRASVGEAFRRLGAKFRTYTEAARRAARKEEPEPDLVPVVAAERIAEELAEKSRSPLLRLMRRNLHRRKADVLSALMVLAQVLIGVTPLFGDTLDELGEMTPEKSLFHGAGLTPATRTGPGGIPPWISGGAASLPDVLTEVERIGIADVHQLARLVEESTDEEFDQAREAVLFLVEDMPVFVKGLGVLFGRDVMGLGIFRLFGQASTNERMLMIPLCIALHRRFGMQWSKTFKALRVEVRKIRPQAEALYALGRVFPQYKRYFSVNLAQRLASLPEKERSEIVKDVRGYLKTHHPEVLKAAMVT